MATETGSGTRRLVIVESPSKATKIAGYLGPDYVVMSSVGHIRDLPSKADEVPAKYKGLPWARTGVDIDNDFEPLYVVNADKKKTIRELKSALADSDELLLATDGDREGEAIAWHLLAELKPKVPVKRMVFHEITEHAILDAVKNTRDLDMDLVNAQETRRIVDRLYGFEVSPVLWRKVQSGSSAGRVQSVTTRLVVDRERERIAFVEAGYWDLDAVLDSGEGSAPRKFPARLTEVGGKKVAQGRDFSPRGELTSSNLVHLDQSSATALGTRLEQAAFTVTSVTAKPYTRKPYPPFRTTTLQQEAGRKLHMSSQTTMAVAQKLYEGGFITYMRTDSVTLSSSAINAARDQARQLFGPSYVPDKPRLYSSKVKNAQEAHEAIRPAGDSFRTPAQTGLHGNELKLYELVWMRTVASQMKDAVGESIQVSIQAKPGDTGVTSAQDSCTFAASGRTITFHGFLKAYVEAVDESDGKQSDDQQTRLPQLTNGQLLDAEEVTASGHSTRPPARYSEPSLVAKMEELEIGRPSTYASIINVIVRRNYVFKKGTALVPTWLAFAVTKLLEQHFDSLVDYDFTAEMEDTLDAVAKGDTQRLKVLQEFYFGGKHFGAKGSDDSDAPVSPGLKALVEDLGEIDARKMSTFPIGDFDSGINLRLGQYGPYLEQQIEGADPKRANVPAGIAPDELTLELARELLSPKNNDREIGTDPVSGNTIIAKNGRFGPYVTEVLGEDAPKDVKPRTGSLFASMDLDTVSLEQALQLINLPRVVGKTEDGSTVTARNGPNGAYLSKIEPGKEKGDTRNLDSEEQIFTVTLEDALARFAQPKQRGRGAAKPPLKELGDDPVSGKPMVVKEGRFGPYVTDGVDNASLRRSDIVEEVTTARGAELLAERRAKGPVAKKAPARKAPAKKAAAKKAPAKKAAAKKAPAKKTAAKKTAAKKAQ